jgi:serine/threonine protein kinase
VKDFPDFVQTKRGRASIWLRRELARPAMIELFCDIDRLFERPDCIIVKDQRKIKVGRVSVECDGAKAVVYIKRYNVFSLRYRVQSFLSHSGAAKSLRGAKILEAVGVCTARPFAAVEHRCGGLLLKSFFVSEDIEGGKTLDAFWQEELAPLPGREGERRRRLFLQTLARLFSCLHAHDVYHNDLKDANILIAPKPGTAEDAFFLLDLDGVRRYPQLSRRRRVKNLVQLNRTFGKYLRRTELLFFLNCYLSGTTKDRAARKRWAEDVFRRSIHVDRVKMTAT